MSFLTEKYKYIYVITTHMSISSIDLNQLATKVMDLIDALDTDKDLQKKITNFANRVKDIDAAGPKVEESVAIIYEYIKVVTDLGDIYVPIQIYAKSKKYIYQTAELLKQFITEHILPVVKDITNIVLQYAKGISSLDGSNIYSLVLNALGKAILIATDQKVLAIAESIGSNVQQIKLIADTSKDETFELVEVGNVKDMDALSKLTIDVLDFLNELWNSIVYPFVMSFVNTNR